MIRTTFSWCGVPWTTANWRTTTATTRAVRDSARWFGSLVRDGRWRNALRPQNRRPGWTTIRCASTTRGTATSRWPCSPWHSWPRWPAPLKRGPVHCGQVPAHARTNSPNEAEPGTGTAAAPPPRRRRLAALTLGEVRRLFNVIGAARDAIDHAIHWSNWRDRKSTRLNSSHLVISYAVFCLKKKTIHLPVITLRATIAVSLLTTLVSSVAHVHIGHSFYDTYCEDTCAVSGRRTVERPWRLVRARCWS